MEALGSSIFLAYTSILTSLSVGIMQIIASTQLTSSNKYTQETKYSLWSGLILIAFSIISFLIMRLNKSKSSGWVYLVLTLNIICLIGSSVVGGIVTRAIQCDKDSDPKINTAYNMSLYSSWIGLIVGFFASIMQGFIQRERLLKTLSSAIGQTCKALPCIPQKCVPVPCYGDAPPLPSLPN